MNRLVLSLFPGIGLLDRAFELEGWLIVRGPDVLWGGDIRGWSPRAAGVEPGTFAGVIGGPPCQSFSSLANLVLARGYEPRFGNLIPEFERVVMECEPAWFLMENVPAAPSPMIGPHLPVYGDGEHGARPWGAAADGYSVHSFLLNNSHLCSGDGMGEEQERVRRWSFGVRGEGPAPDLRRWIKLAALLLPEAAPCVVAGEHGDARRWRTAAVRSGAGLEQTTAYEQHRRPPVEDGEPGSRQPTVTGSRPSGHRPKGGRGDRRSIAEMLRLQGLPPDYLDECPLTQAGKRKAIGNGVPTPMGRALARAVHQASKRI